MSRPILVSGANGQLGTELARLGGIPGWRVIALGREALDLADPDAIAATVAAGDGGDSFAAVINAGAYTAVDRAEREPVAAWLTNALGPAALAAACARSGIPLVHVSTDYVFAGDKLGAWDIDDPVGPLGVYGASKLGGELAVRTGCPRHVIVRTAWVVSAQGSNFLRTMLRLAADRDAVRVVADQIGSPTSARDLADALLTIAIRLAGDAAPTGIVHFSNAGAVSWAGFASEIFRQSALRGGPWARVEPITTADYPTPARRPANSLLSHEAIGRTYGIVPRPWQTALSDIIDEVVGPSPEPAKGRT